ncbi:hypothetical protein [Pseudomonas sp. ADAK13]|uniref:hypothetical protein n=1 Tax=Pseudomonas sp. ADAK13 TaxID=2730847 RepID=UPI001463DEBF|nr:hypothetical protein [Pseudomonas sp. ADAK13]QJI37515.1 hypothetical protein HKK54_24940 [Pseudomonas sp. ADAK13]
MKKTGSFVESKESEENATVLSVPITLLPAVPAGLVNPALYPGLLTRAAVDRNLELQVPSWVPVPSVLLPADVDEYVDDVGNFESGYIRNTRVFDATPFVGVVPVALLTQGTHTYSYKVTTTGGTNIAGSAAVTFIVDRLAPYDTAGIAPFPLTTPAGWPGALTEAFLAASGDEVEFPIPDYDAYGAAPGDTWELSLSLNGPVVATGDVFPDLAVKVTRALAQAHEGLSTLYYKFRDASGNISRLSLGLPITIALRPAPVLASPGIVDALTLTGAGDRLIDLPDTAKSSGMFVIIPSYDADRAQDNFYVRLTTLVGTQEIGPLALNGHPLPFNFHVGFATLLALYGASTGAIALEVGYSVDRGGVRHPVPVPSTISLDLDKAGPVNPDAPDLVNPRLPRPELTGATSGLNNQLDASDALQDAPVIVTLWSDPPLPDTKPFDIVLFYGGEEVDRVTVNHLTANPGDDIDMNVAWPFIAKHSNGRIPLHYELATPGTNNRDVSPTQPITVAANVISFNAPSIVNSVTIAPGITLIGCTAMPAPTYIAQIRVPPHPLMTAGMIIRVNWNAYSDNAGTSHLPAVSTVFTYGPLTATETVSGFNVPVAPYDTRVKPINAANPSEGAVRITYSVPVPGPSPVDSAEAYVIVNAVVAGPAYCDGSPWP